MAANGRQWPPMAANEIFGPIAGGPANGRQWPPMAANGRQWPPMAKLGKYCKSLRGEELTLKFFFVDKIFYIHGRQRPSWLPMANDGRQWLPLAANGCTGSQWPPMAASGRQWLQ